MITCPDIDTARFRHGFFTREGGVSTGIYAGLQCGWGAKGDTVANVTENRARAAAALGVSPDALVTACQIHSARAVRVEAAFDRASAPEADALVTDRPGIALGILTADCVPILFADGAHRIIGAAHAGWQGALGGVIEATLAAMADLGADPATTTAAIGPCIRQAAYQVDGAYRGRFVADDPGSARFFGPDPDHDRWRFDLPGYCAARLGRAGVARVHDTGLCTCADAARFYSNRRALHRGEGDYGRGLSVIAMR